MSPFRSAAAQPSPDPTPTALALRAQGRLQEALDILSNLREATTDSCILRGDLQLELGQIQEAAASYAAVTLENPDHVYAHGQLGTCLYRLQQWEAAARSFETVLQFDPHRDEVRLNLSDCLLRMQHYGLALTCFDQCWSAASRQRALFGKAVALQLLRRFDEAETHYERLLAMDPTAHEALTNLIAMSMEVFELGRVEKYSQRLLELDSRSTFALQGLALVAIERREYSTAARHFYRLAELQPAVLRKPAESSDTVEYRISRKIFDNLEAARRQLNFKTAQMSGGPASR